MAASSAETLARMRRTATYQDVLDAPAHQVAEIINGTLHTHPRPAVPHTRASSVLGRKIGAPYDDEVGGRSLTSDMIAPNVAQSPRE